MTSVGRLFLSRRPSTVARLVAAIVINSLYRHARRRFAHVGKKVFKIVPTGANANTTGSVGFEAGTVGVFASLDHRCPARKGRRSLANARVSMAEIKRACDFSLATATTGRVPRSQRANPSNHLCSTIAVAEPSRAAFLHGQEADDREPPKALIRDISESGHGDLSTRLLRQVTTGCSKHSVVAQL
jgi:hypothetical protein